MLFSLLKILAKESKGIEDDEAHDKKGPSSTKSKKLILRHPSQVSRTQHNMKLINQFMNKC